MSEYGLAGAPAVIDEVRDWQPDFPEMGVFDTSFDYKTDKPAKTRPDPDRDSPRLRELHQLLWSKKLNSGVRFELTAHVLVGTATSSLIPPRGGIGTAATPSLPPTPAGYVRRLWSALLPG